MRDVKNTTNTAIKANDDHRSAVENAYDYVENFDILETINNVGNDEVFTPRKICNEMLDSLPDEVWYNKDYKWLNPCTKNGVFEREIAIRLDEGLKNVITNEEERRKHILTKMIFSIGLTKFTSHVARRTLYYCTEANRRCDGIKASDGHYVNGYAIGNGTWFDTEEGNILTPCTDHKFEGSGENAKCKYCGIKKNSSYVDPLQREQYAYEFIHVNHLDLQKHLQKRFFGGNKDMKFDIIIGNPPYQLSDGGAQASARPIYQLFINQAICLAPKYLCMIVPSRWMTGGKGLDDFRNQMIRDKRISVLVDYFTSKDVFPNVDVKGGVCYFVWKNDYKDKCKINSHTSNGIIKSFRYLSEGDDGIFIRDERLLRIKEKTSALKEATFDTIVSASKPYGLRAETMVSKLPNMGYRIFH